MTWQRPIPLVGDTSSARERASDPRAWAMSGEEREAIYRVLGARRDIRRFRSDPVPDEVLTRILGAAHAAPSVGHSQPWRFVIVTSPETRERAAMFADRERLDQAASLEPEAGRQLRDLQLEGIRQAPVGIVVCCDRRVAAQGVLGRATFRDADLWSCACAIQNLWIAARAEGVGVGWVTLFKPDDLAALIGLPDHVVTLGWLCLGWPNERPPDPGLERAGWSRRQPLASVVINERWPDGATPAPISRLRAPNQQAVVAARDSGDDLLTPPGSLGVLDSALDRVWALGREDDTGGTLVLVGADHPVTRHRVSVFDPGVTRQVMQASLVGESLAAISAAAAGLVLLVVDAGVDAGVDADSVPGAVNARPQDPRGDIVTDDALSEGDVARLIGLGQTIGSESATHGWVALGEVGIGNTTVATALAALYLGIEDLAGFVGLGAGGDSVTIERKGAAISAAVSRTRTEGTPYLQAVGGPEIAFHAGVILGVAGAGGVVILDGLATTVAALAAVEQEPAVLDHLIAGQRSRERAHAQTLNYLGLEPLLDLRLRAGEGVGAVMATQMLQTANQLRKHTGKV